MSPEQRLELLGYLTVLRSFLRMDSWNIMILNEVPEDEDVYARCEQSRNHDTMTISLGKQFWDLSDGRKTNTLVHEMIHAQHRDVSLLWEDVTKGNSAVSTAEFISWDGDFHTFMERMVSNLTRVIAPLGPQWPVVCPVGAGIALEDDYEG